MSSSAKKEESRIKYEAATKPKETYKTPKGETKPISKDAPVSTVRKYVTHETYTTYTPRASVFYGPYYNTPQPYNDWFSPFFMGYLLSSSVNSHDRATWVYNHRSEIDETRYRDLLAKDAELKARLEQLEKEKAARDPGYVLPSMKDNPDLQYSPDFIDSAYNPVAVEEPAVENAEGDGVTFTAVVITILVIIGIAGLIWLLFVKEFDGLGE